MQTRLFIIAAAIVMLALPTNASTNDRTIPLSIDGQAFDCQDPEFSAVHGASGVGFIVNSLNAGAVTCASTSAAAGTTCSAGVSLVCADVNAYKSSGTCLWGGVWKPCWSGWASGQASGVAGLVTGTLSGDASGWEGSTRHTVPLSDSCYSGTSTSCSVSAGAYEYPGGSPTVNVELVAAAPYGADRDSDSA